MDMTSVFGQLRSLTRRLDQGVIDIQDKIDNPKQDSESSSAQAYKHLQDVKKEVHALKEEARDNLGSVQIANKRFLQLLQVLPQVIEQQRQSLTSIEEYLQQYGYVRQEKKLSPDESGKEKTGGETNVAPCDVAAGDDGDDDDGTVTVTTTADTQDNPSTPPAQTKPSECKTPCLEDFVISSLTLNLLQKGGTYSTSRQQPVSSQFSIPPCDPDFPEESPTPTSFKHNGLLVTPSLMGGMSILEQTPDCTRTVFGIPHLRFSEDSPAPFMGQLCLSAQKSGVYQYTGIQQSHAMGSPVPPVLNMPGAKQINKKLWRDQAVKKTASNQDTDSPIPPLLMTPGAKQITKNLSAPTRTAPISKPDNDSPAVPVLMTPGTKQIQKTLKMPEPPVSASDWDKEPEMPELTMSLQDITQLTQSFRLNSYRDQPELPVTKSNCLKDRETPPLPELLSSRLAKLGALPGTPTTNTMTTSRGDTISATILGMTKDNTPPPPTLLGKYSFQNKYREIQENIPPYEQ